MLSSRLGMSAVSMDGASGDVDHTGQVVGKRHGDVQHCYYFPQPAATWHHDDTQQAAMGSSCLQVAARCSIPCQTSVSGVGPPLGAMLLPGTRGEQPWHTLLLGTSRSFSKFCMNAQPRHPVWGSGTAHGAASGTNTGRREYQVESCDSVYGHRI